MFLLGGSPPREIAEPLFTLYEALQNNDESCLDAREVHVSC